MIIWILPRTIKTMATEQELLAEIIGNGGVEPAKRSLIKGNITMQEILMLFARPERIGGISKLYPFLKDDEFIELMNTLNVDEATVRHFIGLSKKAHNDDIFFNIIRILDYHDTDTHFIRWAIRNKMDKSFVRLWPTAKRKLYLAHEADFNYDELEGKYKRLIDIYPAAKSRYC